MQPLSMYTILIVVVGIFPAVWLLIQIYWWLTRHNVVKESLLYSWTNLSSNPNPLRRFWIAGHRWATTTDLKNFSAKQKAEAKKKGLKPIFVGNFRVWNKYAEDLHLPKILRNEAEKTPLFIDPWSMAQTMLGIGGAGGGKSIFVFNIAKQMNFALNVFFSKKGEYEKMFHRPGIDFMLNPILEDGSVHDILSEEPEMIMVFVESLMNASLGKSQDYFSGSAKQRLKIFCEKVKVNERDKNTSKIQKWEDFIGFYEEAVTKAQGGKQKSELDVLSTVTATFREGLYLMAYRVITGAHTFTAKDFIFRGNKKQNLFITGNNPAMLNLSAASLAVLIKYQLSRPDIEDWEKNFLVGWILDEYRSLMRIVPSEILAELSEVGRGKRICPLKFLQKLDKEDSEETSDLISNMMYLVVFSTTDSNTKKILTGMYGDIIYREKTYNEERGKDRGMLRDDHRVSYPVVYDYHLDILQNEMYSSIFFSPKQALLTKLYTPMADIKPKDYVDVTTKIDEVEFIKWRMQREKAMDSGAVKDMMKDEVIEKVLEEVKNSASRPKPRTYEDELKEALNEIVDVYGDNPKYKNYNLVTSATAMKSKHGDYYHPTRTIRIFDMVNIPREHFFGTAIHELSHHIEAMDTGTSGHSKNFYTIYKKLIDIAMEKKIVDYKIMKESKIIDSGDITQLERYFPELKER